jgi:hypothetical protein
MEGASSAHPLHDPAIPEVYLAAWDEVLRPINKAQPLRIARKREAFRKITSQAASMEQRSELLAASLFAHAGIAFEFAKDHPDLVFAGGDWGIEVGSRAIDDPWSLHAEIKHQTVGLKIILTFDGRPLHLGSGRVVEIAEEVAAVARRGPGSLRFDAVGLTIGIGAAPFDSVHVSMSGQRLTSELKDHMSEIEQEIDNKIDEKRRQAQKMPTVLLLDISRVGDAFLHLPAVWTDVLKEKLKDESASYAGLGVMISSLNQWLPMQLNLVISDDAPNEARAAFNGIAELFYPKHSFD